MLAADHIWRELGLEATLDQLTRPGRSDATTLDRAGRRWLPAWREDAERLPSKTPRGRVAMHQPKQW
jgi:hypothetical protein